MTSRPPVAASIAALADELGRPAFAAVCVDLLGGAPRERYVEELRLLTGHGRDRGTDGGAGGGGDGFLDHGRWQDYWVRSWGARGLLHVWHEPATPAVVAGLDDAHYRPAEMCLKVATRHEVAGSGDGAARLAAHPLPRVRAQAARCLGVNGDTDHLDALRRLLDDPSDDVRRQAARARAALADRLDLLR